MNDSKADGKDWAANSNRNTLRLKIWTAAWVLTSAFAAFGPKLAWDFSTLPTIGAQLLNLGTGIGMIVATRRYVLGLDELQQKIFLQAGALTLGVGLVCGLSYELLEDVRLISFEPEIPHLVMLMCITFLVSTVAGYRRYR
ncbi:MAG: hypothetical protein WBM45_11860 [Woeseiaceae bacterium]|jgi:hypothetical protein